MSNTNELPITCKVCGSTEKYKNGKCKPCTRERIAHQRKFNTGKANERVRQAIESNIKRIKEHKEESNYQQHKAKAVAKINTNKRDEWRGA